MASPSANPASVRNVPAAIERYFQTSLFFLIVTGFATLASTGKLDAPTVLFVGAALAFRGYQLWTNNHWQIPEQITSYLGLIYLFVYVVDLFLISGNFVQATVHLLLFGMTVKVFSIQRDRDFLYLAMLAFLEVLSAAILTVDSVFLGALTVFVLIAVVTFMTLEMRRSAQHAARIQQAQLDIPHRRSAGSRFRPFPYSLSATGVVMVVSILLCSVAIFFLLPRLSGGYLSKLAQQNDLVSGFSDTVQLGEIGRIQQSSQVVAHVRIENGASDFKVLLRGSTLSNFDGRAWFNPPHYVESLSTSSGSYNLRPSPESPDTNARKFATGTGAHHSVIRYRVTMEPIGTNVIFLIPAPFHLFAPFREISADRSLSFMNTDRERSINSYEGISDISQPSVQELEKAGADFPDEVTARYLQLPNLDPRIPALASEITAKSRNELEKAAAIQAYLGKFAYTLDLPATRPADPLANFLFERKAGHCEYFASAMTVLLRTQGIPARMVNGFRGGEFNELTGNYIIRAKEAHSWVEAYFPNYGWVMFDPTPGAAPPVITAWTRMQLYVDAMREFWREWIVNYDFFHQQRLSYAALNTGTHYVESMRHWAHGKYARLMQKVRRTHRAALSSPREFVVMGMVLLGAITFLLYLPAILRTLRKRRLAAHPAREPQMAASIWYQRLTSTLARRGMRKQPSQTPREFAAAIADPQVRQNVSRFTDHYERARFGNSAADAVQLPTLFRQITERN